MTDMEGRIKCARFRVGSGRGRRDTELAERTELDDVERWDATESNVDERDAERSDAPSGIGDSERLGESVRKRLGDSDLKLSVSLPSFPLFPKRPTTRPHNPSLTTGAFLRIDFPGAIIVTADEEAVRREDCEEGERREWSEDWDDGELGERREFSDVCEV